MAEKHMSISEWRDGRFTFRVPGKRAARPAGAPHGAAQGSSALRWSSFP